MPARVQVPYESLRVQCDQHTSILHRMSTADPWLQRFVAEMIMLRLFDAFQNAISGIATRLICGTDYADGSSPSLFTAPANSGISAVMLMRTFGRSKMIDLNWSKASYINANTRKVLDASDHFTITINNYSTEINEMRIIRNRIAHANTNSRRAFARVVQSLYGASRPNVSAGMLLLSPRFSPMPSPLSRYIITCRAIAKDCARI